jgi:tripartite-type tricarboxylate transporter receptor subunit TctC
MNDLIPGRVDAMFANLPGAIGQVRSGTIRALGVTSATRSPAAPDLPTIGETVPGYEVFSWWGVYLPAKTPDEIIRKVNADTAAALAHPSVAQRYDSIGAPIVTTTPAEAAALLQSEIKKWGPIVKDAGIQPE